MGDELVAAMVSEIEDGNEALPLEVSLYCEGFFVAGEMISETEFLRITLSQFEEAAARFLEDPTRRSNAVESAEAAGYQNARAMSSDELAELFNVPGRLLQTAISNYDLESAKRHVHLKEATVFSGGIERKHAVWRCSLEAVKGFAYGG
ncbi:hypothetical protein [Rubrobacter aplysinae]|uniref:hypothetical protein n=1 Tax=Rubrobacter aplysinae TaxID=909625 RepID=UPI00128B62AB|nr:hypothetical protein [Rubrobacter aplysinae]